MARLSMRTSRSGPPKTLAEQVGDIVDVLMTLERVAAVQDRSADVTEQLVDHIMQAGSALHTIARGHGAAAACLRP